METPAQLKLPLSDVRNAFKTYLQKYNHGRPFVLIGHSQGSFVLEQLIAKDVDPKPLVRRRLLSAILMGGNVLVKKGTGIGGNFKHIPACKSATQLACVIAFSTFDQTPPANAIFGRTTVKGDQVLCVNPAALLHSSGVQPIFPSAPFAPGTLIATGIALLKITQPMPPTVWSSEPGSMAEKDKYPSWKIDQYHVYPDPRSRFADWTNPDRPPAPPDDPAAYDMAPRPQKTPHSGVAYIEGTGYLDLLACWDKENRARQEKELEEVRERRRARHRPAPPRRNGPSRSAIARSRNIFPARWPVPWAATGPSRKIRRPAARGRSSSAWTNSLSWASSMPRVPDRSAKISTCPPSP